MKNIEDHELLLTLAENKLENVAEKLMPVLDKRDADIDRLSEKQHELFNRVDTLLNSLEDHINDEADALRKFIDAFPNNDPEGHRKFHEGQIEAARAQKAFWEDLKRDIAKKGLVGLIVIVTGLIITGAAVKLGIHK